MLDAVTLWTLQQNELSAGAVGTFQPFLGQGSYQGATGSVAPSCVPRCWWSCAGRAVHCRAPEQEPVNLQLVKTPSAVTCSGQLLVGRFTLLFSSSGKEDRFCLSVLLLHVQRCFPACAQPFL